MVGWHHRLNGHEFGWTPGVGDGQGGLACCSPWGRKEMDTTEWLHWTERNHGRSCWETTWGKIKGTRDPLSFNLCQDEDIECLRPCTHPDLSATAPLNSCHKTPPWTHLGWDSVSMAWACSVPWAWQSNKAVLSSSPQNSASEVGLHTSVQRGWAFSITSC